MTSINTRVELLITELGLNPNSFSVRINRKPQTTNKIVKGLNKPGYDYLEAVLSTFREISAEWLMIGEGSIRKGEPTVKPLNYDSEKISALEATIESQKELIEELKKDKQHLWQLLHKNTPQHTTTSKRST